MIIHNLWYVLLTYKCYKFLVNVIFGLCYLFNVAYHGLCLLHGLHVMLRLHVTFNYLLMLHGSTCECCLLLIM
jgi:hypothetical protein